MSPKGAHAVKARPDDGVHFGPRLFIDNAQRRIRQAQGFRERRTIVAIGGATLLGVIAAVVAAVLSRHGGHGAPIGRVDPHLRQVMLGWMNRSREVG